jgi:hypothetical protein
MSDISLNLRAIDLAAIALILGSPGLVVGGGVGALLWRSHRLAGAAIGAVAGVVLWAIGWFYLKEII